MTFTRNDADSTTLPASSLAVTAAPAATAPSLPAATISRHVEWIDTDAAGQQHNSSILRWMETCEAELFRNLGLDDYFPRAPRVQQVVNYTARLFFGQQVTTSVSIQKLGRTSLTLGFEVIGEAFRGRERVSAANGHVVVVHMAPGAERSSPWPEAMLAAIHGLDPREP